MATTANPTKVIAAAKTMSLHGSLQTEESSTKDTTGDALEYEAVGASYDISGSAQIITPSDTLNTGANSFNDILSLLGNTTIYWRICLMDGTNNRTVDEEICHGTGKLTSINPTGQNRQTATFSYTLTGYGDIALPTAASSQTDNG